VHGSEASVASCHKIAFIVPGQEPRDSAARNTDVFPEAKVPFIVTDFRELPLNTG
jgi:hypothetical protein